jgi:hypothetical protein
MLKRSATPGLVAIGCTIPVSSWWFIQLTGLIDIHSQAIGDVSIQAMHAILILQFLSVCLFCSYWAGESHDRSSRQPALVQIAPSVVATVLPAWPLLAMLSIAGGISASQIIMAEASLFTAGLAVALIARAMHNLNLNTEINRLLPSVLGLASATLFWLFRTDWFDWVGL